MQNGVCGNRQEALSAGQARDHDLVFILEHSKSARVWFVMKVFDWYTRDRLGSKLGPLCANLILRVVRGD